MLALGIICLLLAAALVVGVLLTGTSQEVVFNSAVGDVTTNPLWVFVAGAVAMLLVLLGLSFFGRGTRRRVARRKEMKRLRKVEEERGSRPVPTTGSGSGVDAGSGTGGSSREGYDQPDRQLVREPRPDQTSQTGRAEQTDLTATEPRVDSLGDDAARHRER